MAAPFSCPGRELVCCSRFSYTKSTPLMDDFTILTNRRRAIIALLHSVAFLLLAVHTLATARVTPGLTPNGPRMGASVVMAAVFFVVTSVLLVLVRYSGCAKERLYFGFCASSAALGLLRAVFGDSPIHVGLYLRVLMLLCAVLVGMAIVRIHSEASVAE